MEEDIRQCLRLRQPHSHLAHTWVARGAWRTEGYRALADMIVYALAGALGLLVAPAIGLILFCVLPVFYAVSSEGQSAARGGLPSRRQRE
jgi:hypothetical protein